jgi:maleate cis-trans isomerase
MKPSESQKAVSHFGGSYGWRARIGLIVPATNTNMEPEFHRLAPPGVLVTTTRLMLPGKQTMTPLDAMAANLDAAAAQLATCNLDIVAYGHTAGSFVMPCEEIVARIVERTDTLAVTAFQAVRAALGAFGARRIAVGTPYMAYTNKMEVKHLAAYGIEVSAIRGLGLGETMDERSAVGQIPAETAVRLARSVDSPEADMVFLSGTNFACIDTVPLLESLLDKPVITSTQATFWHALRTLGLKTPIHGAGRLLEEH